MDATGKPWDRPWTTQEMVDHASDWSLAADVGLFKHLEKFADNMMKKAEETNENLEKHIQHLQSVSQRLDIEKCRFLSLQNTQFIENRVYEDDETDVSGIDTNIDKADDNNKNVNAKKDNSDVNDADKSENTKSTPIDRKQVMISSVMKGLEMLDKYYDKVDVPASDSDEDTASSFILRPKDPYLSRPLPYIIGSEEWHKKWHVGLLESSSESEDEKVSERYSDSESDDNLPVTNRSYKIPAADATSEDSDKIYRSHPIAHSASKDSYKSGDTLYKSEHSYKSDENSFRSGGNEEVDSLFQQPQVGSNVFAEELAAKLGDVLTSSNTNKNSANTFNNPAISEAEVNRNIIQRKPVSKFMGDFFDDEPPPLVDNNDTKDRRDVHGLFSGGSGLFDDDDDEEDIDSLWNKAPIAKTIQTKKLQPSQLQDAENPINKATNNKPTSSSIFDEHEDDLFSQPKETSKGNISEDPVKDDGLIRKAKKPTGGVAIVPNLFLDKKDLNILKQRSMSTDEDAVDEARRIPKVTVATNVVKSTEHDKSTSRMVEPEFSVKDDSAINKEVLSQNIPPKVSLFDDDESDLFLSDDIFSNITTKKFTSDLFSSDDLFAPNEFTQKPSHSNVEHESSSSTRKVFYTDIFEDSPPPIENRTPQIQKEVQPIEKNTIAPEAKTTPLENKNQLIDNKPPLQVKSESGFPEIREATKKPIVSLFGDDDDIEDDLFGSYNPTEVLKRSSKDSARNIFDKFDSTFGEDKTAEEVSVDNSGSSKIEELINSKTEGMGILKVEGESSMKIEHKNNLKTEDDIFKTDGENILKTGSESLLETERESILETERESILKSEDVSSPKSEDEFASIIQSTVQKVHSNYQADDLFEEPPPLPSSAGGLSKLNDNSELEINYDDWDTNSDIFEDFSFNTKKLEDTSKNTVSKDEEIVVSTHEKTNTTNEKSGLSDIGKSGKINVKENPNDVAESVPKPAVRPSKIKLSNEFLPPEEPPPKEEVRSPPGKLKHNLNINVNALLPGLGPPRKKEVVVPVNEERTESNLENYEAKIKDSETNIKGKELNIENKSNIINSNEGGLTKSSSYSSSIQSTVEKRTEITGTSTENYGEPEILYNVTKDRAKPTKRRPSTRRGRQEQLRKSAIDFNSNEPEDDTLTKNEVITDYTVTDNSVEADKIEERISKKNTIEQKTKQESKDIQRHLSVDSDSFEDIFDSIAKTSQILSNSSKNAVVESEKYEKSEQTWKLEQKKGKSEQIIEKSKETTRKSEQTTSESKTQPIILKEENKAPLQNQVDVDDLFADLFSDLGAKTISDKAASAKNVSSDNQFSRNLFEKDLLSRNEIIKDLSSNDLSSKAASINSLSSKELPSKDRSTEDPLTKDLFHKDLLSKDILSTDLYTNDISTSYTSTNISSTKNLQTKSSSETNRISKYEKERHSIKSANKNTEQESRKSSRNFLFDEDSNDDSDDALFASAKKSVSSQHISGNSALKSNSVTLQKKDSKNKEDYKPKVSLFGDDDDSDDIFSTNMTKSKSSKLESSQRGSSKLESIKFETASSKNPKSKSSISSTKKSLFDDDDMEDDLFGSTSLRKSSFTDDSKITESMQRRKSKTNTMKKLEGTAVTDPLDAFRD